MESSARVMSSAVPKVATAAAFLAGFYALLVGVKLLLGEGDLGQVALCGTTRQVIVLWRVVPRTIMRGQSCVQGLLANYTVLYSARVSAIISGGGGPALKS